MGKKQVKETTENIKIDAILNKPVTGRNRSWNVEAIKELVNKKNKAVITIDQARGLYIGDKYKDYNSSGNCLLWALFKKVARNFIKEKKGFAKLSYEHGVVAYDRTVVPTEQQTKSMLRQMGVLKNKQ